MPSTAKHPEPHVLAAFGRGSLPPDQLSAVAEHVSGCDSCCTALGNVKDDTLVGLARQAIADTPAGESLPSFPVPIDDTEPIPAELTNHPRYQVLAELGAGGMGVVYKAEHRMMGRVVALKVMAPHLTAKATAVDRFHREVKAAAKLMHPNIVTAHDADSAGGLHFLVMEYVDGVSLDRLVKRRGPLPVTMAAQITRQAALGLQHAAEKNMVHRDIKPQNLMVSRKGQVKILDFGLARFARDSEDGANAAATAHNLLMGTPEYLSPEQAKNSSNVDARSDIYSLGCTLYFLLAARVPFPDATTLIDKLLAHTQDEPTPVQEVRPEVPDGLAAVVAKMMAKQPDARYATAADVAAALLPFTKDADPAALPATVPTAVPLFEVVDAKADSRPFALDTADAVVPNGPTLADEPRPTKPKRKKAAAAGLSKGVKRLIGAGVAGVALLVVAGIAGKGKKPDKPEVPPVVVAEKPTETRGGEVKATKGGQAVGKKGANPWNGGNVPVTTAGAKPKVLFIVPGGGVWLDDYEPVRAGLEAANVEVVVASSRPGKAPRDDRGRAGDDVPVDVHIKDVTNAEEYAAVMLCGGKVEEYFGVVTQSGRVIDRIVKEFVRKDKPVGAICVGVYVLATHGQLENRPAAQPVQRMWPLETVPRVRWQGTGVTTDGKLVTASGPDQAADFAQAMLRVIGK